MAAAAAVVAMTVETMTRMVVAVRAKAKVMATAAVSWMPWLKCVRVGHWHKDGDQLQI